MTTKCQRQAHKHGSLKGQPLAKKYWPRDVKTIMRTCPPAGEGNTPKRRGPRSPFAKVFPLEKKKILVPAKKGKTVVFPVGAVGGLGHEGESLSAERIITSVNKVDKKMGKRKKKQRGLQSKKKGKRLALKLAEARRSSKKSITGPAGARVLGGRTCVLESSATKIVLTQRTKAPALPVRGSALRMNLPKPGFSADDPKSFREHDSDAPITKGVEGRLKRESV